MGDGKEAFRKQLELMREKYAREASQKIKDLALSWDQYGLDIPKEALQLFFREAHNLVGSSAAFGLEALGQSAKALETYLGALHDSDGRISAKQHRKVAEYIDRLERGLRKDPRWREIAADMDQSSMDAPRVNYQPSKLIYIVEDDVQQAGELALQLRFLGFETRSLIDLEDARTAIEEKPPAALIMDIIFPDGELAGPDFLHRTKDIRDLAIPVIFTSVRSDFDARLAAIRAGGSYYFEKPVDIRKLADALDELTSSTPHRPHRILIVDDDQRQAELHGLMLEQAGMVTAMLTDPAKIFSVLDRFHPDLILLDLYMPHCDGQELAAMLRQHGDHAMVPIVFLSSEERFEKKVDAMAAGGEDFLTKPVVPEELVAMVRLRADRALRLDSLTSEMAALVRDYENQKFAVDQHVLLIMTDTEGHLTYINDAYAQQSQYKLMDMLGVCLKKGAYKKQIPEHLWTTLEQGEVWRGVLHQLRKDGSNWWLDTSVVPYLDLEGRISQYIWIATDISRYQERRHRLQQARDEAVSALREKRDMLACTSHEMRASLNALSGMTHLLSTTNLSGDQLEFIKNIETAAAHLVDVINKTLDYSKIEAGKLELETIPFNISALVEDVGELLAARAHEKGLDLILSMDGSLPQKVIGDPVRLRQVLTNLINNAIKFTKQGHVSCRLKVTDLTNTTAKIHFEVEDTGIGMTEETISNLFGFYVQAAASTTREYGGTGLGLAISSRLVTAMGGELEVRSQPDVGSCFYFDTPFEVGQGTESEVNFTTRPLILMISEEDPNSKELITRLTTSGALVTRTDHQEIHKITTDARFDVAIVRLTDEQSCRELSRELMSFFPLILLTRYSELEIARRLCSGFYVSHLMLPVRRKALIREINNAIGKPMQEATREDRSRDRIQEELRQLRQQFVILLAEDNPISRKIASTVLASGGYRCEMVSNGFEAVVSVSREAFDLVLMDCMMPEMDGFEATKAIREMPPPQRDIPIIAMTGATQNGEIDHCLKVGMNEHLAKPIDPGALFKTLDTYLLKDTAIALPKSEPQPPTDGPVNLARFLSLTENDPESQSSLLNMFLLGTQRELDNLASAIRNGNLSAIIQLGHGLKGVCGEIGAMDLARIAGELEDMAVNGKLDSAQGLLASLRSEFEKTRQFLNNYLQQT